MKREDEMANFIIISEKPDFTPTSCSLTRCEFESDVTVWRVLIESDVDTVPRHTPSKRY